MDLVSIVISFSIGLVLIIGLSVWQFYLLTKQNKTIKYLKEQNTKILHQKKSSEVRLGFISEQFAPFLTGWPYEAKGFKFLGNPVDGIQFNEDEIIIVEIKSGNARLSKSQKNIKRLVQEGKVFFESVRIDGKGLTVKRDIKESENG